MKVKKEFILLFAVIIASALYLMFRTTDKIHYQLPGIPHISKKEITRIEISKADSSVVLKKKDAHWVIEPEGYPVDTGKIKNMLDVINGLTLTALVSESKNDYLYDLTDQKKIMVKVFDGESVKLEFEVGRAAPSWHHTFIRLAGDSRVYHAEGNFRDKFDLTADELYDKVVLSFNQKDINEITLTKGKKSLTLVRKEIQKKTEKEKPKKDQPPQKQVETSWKTSDGSEVNMPVLKSILSTLSDLRCKKYIDGKRKQDFRNPLYAVALKGVREFGLSIFKKSNGNADGYPAVSSANEYPFLLSDGQAKKIMRDFGDIVEKQKKPQK